MLTDKQIAKRLFEIEALQFSPDEPFKWASGILSPVYCDNRLVMSDVSLRKEIAQSLAEHIQVKYPDVEVIAGCATAGIPHAAWVADILELPMIYVRDKAKGHGKGNRIEGEVKRGQKAVVIEDLISTGKSSIASAQALQEAGVVVVGVQALFSYELKKAEQAFKEASLEYHSLTTFPLLLELMKEQDKISLESYSRLKEWNQDPGAFSYNYQA
ncbi:Orotate phosphoribosyltransferase [Pontibacillus chungwhensis BH030062]|uniref:Orotate phosphoribosyltransferase n=1 Tax=Pontibacillus chungwhensis BH030062 TaxID=1385513 RepID=A0A0A2UX05_9BACI|nr:orotate phosphoribosyltransferase [Pontibacillus chungwhensis]KGP92802.1 Orotate phosphoribosyltransferase [Pontibacillus chungwhensis BH030062]